MNGVEHCKSNTIGAFFYICGLFVIFKTDCYYCHSGVIALNSCQHREANDRTWGKEGGEVGVCQSNQAILFFFI